MLISGIRSNHRGFTLIEVIIYTGLTAIMAGAVITFAWDVTGSEIKNISLQKTSYAALVAAEIIRREVRVSSGIDSASSSFNINIADPINEGKHIALTNPESGPVLIDVVSGVMRIKRGSIPPVDISPTDLTISNLTFTDYSSADGKAENVVFVIEVMSEGARSEYRAQALIRGAAEARRR